ncbi:hypothetical protein Tco_0662905 [Tanacetum coccineum]
MSNLSKDIQCASSDTRPPMLDRIDFALWQQHIQLYCRGKENGVNILKSIDEGPFQMGTFRETLAEGTEGALHLGAAGYGGAQNRVGNANPELRILQRQDVADDLALNVDNVFQVDDCDAFDSDVDELAGEQANTFDADVDNQPPRGGGISGGGSANPQAGPSNASILSEVHILENAIDHSVTNQDEHEIHNEVQQTNVIDSTSVDMGNSNVIPYEQYLSVNNISVVPSCASSALNDVYVSSDNDAFVPHDPIATELKIYKEQVAIYEQRAKFELALTKEIKEMKDVFEELEAEVDQNVVDRKHDEIERKNLLIANDNLIDDCLSKEVFYVASNSELNISRFTKMQDAHNVVQARCLELEAELSKLRDKVQNDYHNELVNRFSNLEVNYFNLQLKYQNLKESFRNNPSLPARDTPDFDLVFAIEKMKASI